MEVVCSEMVRYRRLFQMIIVLGIGGSLQIGYQISVITYPSLFIKRFMNETWLERSGVPLPEKTLLFLWSFTVSIYGLGGLLGSVCSSYLTVKYGKRRTMLGTDLLVITAAFLLGFSRRTKSLEMILIGRFLFGMSAGFCMLIHPQYAGEVSPKKLRGFANATVGFFWSLGKSLGQILGLREALGTEPAWPLLLSFTGITALVQLLVLPLFPESPSYLLIQKGDEGSCLKAMRHLWGQGEHQEEVSDLKKEAAAEESGKVLCAAELLRDPCQRQQLYVLLAVTLTLQLGGINAVYFYMSEVLHTAGFAEAQIPYLALGVGFCELSASVFCLLTIERFGRRSLLWKGCVAMALVTLFLTVTLSLQSKFGWMPHCSLALIFLYVILFGIGPNGVTMSVMMEIFNQSSRPAAFLIGGCLNWAGLFLIGVTFPFAVDALGAFSFLIFTFVLVGSGAVFYLYLPETKGKSIVEITEEFKSLPSGKTLVAVFRNRFHEERSTYSNF